MLKSLMTVGVFVASAGVACAQSINIDFGEGGFAPASTYAGAGRAGVWNEIGVMPTSQRFNLVGLTGQPVSATVYNIGGSALLASNNPATGGDDERLMDDMFLSFNNPVDLCLFFENLWPGEYEVICYAMTPDDAGLLSRVRVDFASPGPVMIGGAWPGAHAQGVTHSRHVVNVTDGRLNPHSGLFGGVIQSGLNGVQLLYLGPCAGDANGDHVVNFADLNTVLSNFGQSGASLAGDVNHDGVVNFADVNLVLSAFGSAC